MADKLLLENGTDHFLLEDGSSLLLMEVASAAYTLTADTSSFAITANTVGLKAARTVTPAVSSFAITPTATGLKRANKLAAIAASFALSAQIVGLSGARKISAAAANYATTPNPVALKAARYLRADPPMHTPVASTEGVSDTEILLSWVSVPGVTGLAVQGVDDTQLLLSWNASTEAADFNLISNAATLSKGYLLPAQTSSFSITVNSAFIRRSPAALVAEQPLVTPINLSAVNNATGPGEAVIDLAWELGPGIYLASNAVGLAAARIVTAQTASFAVTPYAINFPTGVAIHPASASFAITPSVAGLRAARRVSVLSNSFSLTPNNVNLRRAGNLIAGAVSFALTPFNVNLIYTPISDFVLSAQAGSFVFTPNAISFHQVRVLMVDPAAYVFTGYGPTIHFGRLTTLNEPLFINMTTGQTRINIATNQTLINVNTNKTRIGID